MTAPGNSGGLAAAVDQGLGVLVMPLRYQGIGADPDQLRHRFGNGSVGISEMLGTGAQDEGLQDELDTACGHASLER